MKQFLYLDIDIVNSIIAQAEKGLVGELSREHSQHDDTTKTGQGKIDLSGEAGGSLLKLAKAEASLSISGELGIEKETGSESREIISKTLHDAAFDIASAYIEPKEYKIDQDVHESCGGYVLLTRTFEFVDFEYLEKVLGKNGILDFFKEVKKLEKDNPNKKNLPNNINNQQYEFLHKAVITFRQIFPCTRMLASTDGFIVPLDDKYFRVNPEHLGFKYGGQITCVGMITNVIGRNNPQPDESKVFGVLHKQVNDALKGVLQITKEDMYIIHPIAVYYGE